MARFHGSLGFAKTEETAPGVWSEVVTEHAYQGDILRNYQRWQSSENLNENITISNRISLIADAFAYDNLEYIRYILWEGTKWKVKAIEIQRPRLILDVGGVYNG